MQSTNHAKVINPIPNTLNVSILTISQSGLHLFGRYVAFGTLISQLFLRTQFQWSPTPTILLTFKWLTWPLYSKDDITHDIMTRYCYTDKVLVSDRPQ